MANLYRKFNIRELIRSVFLISSVMVILVIVGAIVKVIGVNKQTEVLNITGVPEAQADAPPGGEGGGCMSGSDAESCGGEGCDASEMAVNT